ncbi:MAG: serine/threonine protein kinase, partial [Myxococcota bacterium]
MGEVYVARQIAIDRPVAIKLMRPDRRADARHYRRFIEEARSLSAIQHPNVVTVHDFGQTSEGLLFLVMELVDGRALSVLLGEGRLSVARAVALALQICSGLRASHQVGIVHGDLKPSNVLVSRLEGIGELAKLLDFGLARLTGASVEGGRVQGTPRYMSPEQAAGRALDPRSDIYSLGVMLYEMLAGKPPFIGTLSQLIAQHRDALPSPLDDDIPPPLGQLVMACLAKSPAERPQSGKILQEALESLRDGLSAEPRLRDGAGTQEHFGTGTLSQSLTSASSASLRSDDRLAGPDGEVWVVHRVIEDFSGRTVIEGGPEGEACRRLKVVRIPDELADWELLQQLARWIPPTDEGALIALRDAQIRGRELLLWGDPLPGIALSERLYREDRFPLDEALALAESVARALAVVHRGGLLHLDLRPRHIRLLPDGSVILADPGLWPLVELGLRLYPLEEIQQARRDKPPEQLRGGPLGVEVDLYAVGTLLQRLLSGSGSELAPLAALLERLHQPNPLLRYRSAGDLADDLAALRRGEAPRQGGAFGWLDAPGRLHGRSEALATLDARLAALEAGRGGVVEISGPPGSGRSRLLDEAARRARRQGAVVLVAAPRPGEKDIPYSALRALLGGLASALSALPDADRLAVMGTLREEGTPLGALLHSFAPLLRELLADARQPPEIPVRLARERQLRALLVLFSVLSRAPCQLCIVLDDAQWLDPASAAWLERQRTMLDTAPALLLLATPPAAPRPDRIVLGGLTPDSIEALLAERLGAVDGAVVAAIGALSGGQPGALLALLREGERQGVLHRSREGWSVDPERLLNMAPTADARRRINAHLAALPAPVRSVLEVIAVWSAPIPVPLLEALCDGPALPALGHPGCSTLLGLSAEG